MHAAAVSAEGKTVSREIEREWSFVSWVLQLLLAYCGTLAALFRIEIALNGTDSIPWQLLSYLLALLIGAALALVISAVAPWSANAGRWVWVIPVCFLVSCGVIDAIYVPSDLRYYLFMDPRPSEGESGWVVVLVTLPTWGCCWYSATMRWRWRRRLRRNLEDGGAASGVPGQSN